MRSRVIGEVMGGGRTQRAVEVLYRERFPRFEQVARAIAGDRELGREAVQEGFADALRSVGMRETEYERWRVEYNGLGRTLGPLLRTPPKAKRTRRAGSAHRPKEPLCS